MQLSNVIPQLRVVTNAKTEPNANNGTYVISISYDYPPNCSKNVAFIVIPNVAAYKDFAI